MALPKTINLLELVGEVIESARNLQNALNVNNIPIGKARKRLDEALKAYDKEMNK